MQNIDFKDIDGVISLGDNKFKTEIRITKLSFYVGLDGKYSTESSFGLNFIPHHVGYTFFDKRKNKVNNNFTYLHTDLHARNSIEYLRHIVTQYEKDPMYYILCNGKIIIYNNNVQDHVPIICTYEYLDIITSVIKGYLDDNKE